MAFVAAALLAGCGSSSGGVVTPTTQQLIIGGDEDRDGMVRSNGTLIVGIGGPITGDGDGATNGTTLRQFFSFYIGNIPNGATLVSVTLMIWEEGTIGDPYGKLGEIQVDHMDYGTLDGGDFFLTPLSGNIGTLTSAPQPEGYREMDVTTQVQADITAGRTRSQYRLRTFPNGSNSDNITDAVLFTDTENSISGTGGIPLLVVRYIP